MPEAQRKRKRQEKRAQKKVTYAELRNKKQQAKERKEKYDAEDELYPLTAEVTGKHGRVIGYGKLRSCCVFICYCFSNCINR